MFGLLTIQQSHSSDANYSEGQDTHNTVAWQSTAERTV